MTTSDVDNFFLNRLRQHSAHVYPICAAYEAMERIRQAIIDAKLDCTICTRNPENKKPETYSQAFERLYKIPLSPTNRKVKSNAQ
jgi:uncharacterized protein YutE (UPF0331/DUF86 family)